jgi:hypothetical protein
VVIVAASGKARKMTSWGLAKRLAAHHNLGVMDNRDRTTHKPPQPAPEKTPEHAKEIGGPKGPEPTRYGDWEQNGRCTDF